MVIANEVKLIDFSVAKIFQIELWSPSMQKTSLRKRSSPLVPSYPGLMLTDTGLNELQFNNNFYKALQLIKLQK